MSTREQLEALVRNLTEVQADAALADALNNDDEGEVMAVALSVDRALPNEAELSEGYPSTLYWGPPAGPAPSVSAARFYSPPGPSVTRGDLGFMWEEIRSLRARQQVHESLIDKLQSSLAAERKRRLLQLRQSSEMAVVILLLRLQPESRVMLRSLFEKIAHIRRDKRIHLFEVANAVLTEFPDAVLVGADELRLVRKDAMLSVIRGWAENVGVEIRNDEQALLAELWSGPHAPALMSAISDPQSVLENRFLENA